MRYLLTLIDVSSKLAWALPVHTKDAMEITAEFDQVLKALHPRQPRRRQTDKGIEFFNSDFQALIKLNNIKHFASENEQKAAVMERFNRIVKIKIWT